MNNNFLIYVEGGKEVCMGHVMRCMTLAVALRKQGINVLFLTATPEITEYVKLLDFEIRYIDNFDYNLILDVIRVYSINGCVVDKFGFTKEQHKLIADNVKLFVQIDDFCYDGPANLVINTTLDKSHDKGGATWLCGGKYALIRESFICGDKVIKNIPTDALVTTGFGDPGNIHLMIINALAEIENLKIHVVVGDGYRTKSVLDDIAKENKNIKLYIDCKDISPLVKMCDFAVSAAGTTLYEFAAGGLPCICFPLYDNQIDNIRRVTDKGCIIPLEWYEQLNEERLKEEIVKLHSNVELRSRLSKNGTKWIDGKGAERIARIIKERLFE